MINSFWNAATDLAWIVIATVGGIARYLDQYVRTGRAPHLGLLVAHMFVSGFSGYMVAQTVMRVSPEWALVAAGIGGYLGTQGLDWISSLFTERFGGKINHVDTGTIADHPISDASEHSQPPRANGE